MYCPKCGDAIEQNEKFCNKCRNPIAMETPNSNNNSVFVPNKISTTGNLSQSQQSTHQTMIQQSQQVVQQPMYQNNHQMNVSMLTSTPQYKPINPITKVLAGAGIGLIILSIFVLVLFVIGSSTDYYYSDNDYENDVPTITQTHSQNKPQTQSDKQPTKTIIVTDNYYKGAQISTIEEINKLIIQDSVSQKDNCPANILDIENNLIKKYGITAVNLCELDINFAKEINDVFEKIYNEYPSARGVLSNFTVINSETDENYIAAFMSYYPFAESQDQNTMGIKTQIFLNTKYFYRLELAEKNIKNSSRSGHFPPNATMYSTIAHELGHYLSFISAMKSYDLDTIRKIDAYNYNDILSLMNDWRLKIHSLSMLETAYNNYKKNTNAPLKFDEWRATISQYAVTKDSNGEYLYDETVAEAFHDVYLNDNNAADASKYIVEVLKSELEG